MAYFEEIFRDMERFQRRMMERMAEEMEEIEEAVRSGKLEGEWDFKPISRPGVKGYVARGRFWPREPWRTPLPAEDEVREPLTDVFEDKEAVKLYVELPGVEKDDIQLNIRDGKAEIRAKNFYKAVNLPSGNLDAEKASANYKNGVLEVTIPKTKGVLEEKKQKIKIE
ncbi:MAG: Hsp20/alpha crystallin family protein [Candidatus Bathyarchaeia archaeon]